MKKKKVCVQGLGFVGSAMCTAIASVRDKSNEVKYEVVGIELDTDEGRKKNSSINSGELLFSCEDEHFKEKLYESSVIKKNLRASSDINEYKDADIIIVDVGLDVDKVQGTYLDPVVPITMFKEAVRSFAKFMRPECLVIVETTVPPGTSEHVVEKTIIEEFKKRDIIEKPLVCHSYERVMPGKNYLHSITHINRNYSANSEKAGRLAKEFFENLIATKEFPLTFFDNTKSTEIAKVLENSYRAMNIAFIQEWTELAEEMGVNLFSIIDAIKARKGTHDNMMKPGFGVGGYCLPKDPLFAQWSLNQFHGSKKMTLPLTLQSLRINDKMPMHTFKRIKETIGSIAGKKVLICGVSYIPNVADSRNSPAKTLYDLVKSEGGTCKITDAILDDYEGFPKEDIFKGESYSGFDVIVFTVRHKKYLEMDVSSFSQDLKENCLVVDAFDIFPDEKIKKLLENGIRVVGIGKGHIINMMKDSREILHAKNDKIGNGKMVKILITGGAGFIGYHLAEELSEDPSNEITIADNLKRGREDKYFSSLISKANVKFLQVDLTNKEEVKQKIWEHFDQIYHLAAVVGVKHCMKDPAKVLDVNLSSTLNIIELAKSNRCGRLLFSSTCETYANGFEFGITKVPTSEDAPLVIKDVKNPRMSYAGSKIVGEQLVIFNSSEFDQESYDYAIVRYHNIYGPRMGYAHILPEVVKRGLMEEDPFNVYGHDQTRAFCYISDAVEQTILAMNHENTRNQVLHIGNSQGETKIIDSVKEILSEIDFYPELKLVSAPPGSVNRRCPDTAKIRMLTGFTPKVSVKEGFRKTAAWYGEDIKENGAWE